jgi:DNA polymerase V
MQLYDRIIDKRLLARRVNITANNVISEERAEKENSSEQINLFTDYKKIEEKQNKEKKERNLQKSILDIKKKYGKNAILKGMNFEEGATTIERNGQIGGHKG